MTGVIAPSPALPRYAVEGASRPYKFRIGIACGSPAGVKPKTRP